MTEFNIEDLDAVISEAKSSLVQMLALQLQKELKNVAGLEGKNSLLQSKLDLINGLMDATKPAIEIVEQGVSELQSQNAELAVQLANAESKCRELAAENAALKGQEPKAWYIRISDEVTTDPTEAGMWRGVPLVRNDVELPATDAYLKERGE